MEITEVIKTAKVAIEILFEKPFKGRNETMFRIEPESGDPS
jgi:hypothetical protein